MRWKLKLGMPLLLALLVLMVQVRSVYTRSFYTLGVARVGSATPVCDEVRNHFPPARGWFRLVQTATFRELGSNLVPEYSSLTHVRIRRSDGAGHTVVPSFPRAFTEPLRVSIGDDPNLWVDVSPSHALPAQRTIETGIIVYPNAYADTDVLYKATPTHLDEYLLLRSASAPTTWRYRIQPSSALPGTHATTGVVELLDERGRARLRASRPFAIDAKGTRVDGEIRLHGNELELSVNVQGLEFPVLVDPDWAPTGDMAWGRFYHTSNTLPDGRVLSIGGCSASVCSGDLTLPACRTLVSAAETLDLGSRTWSRAGEDPVARFFHSAELTNDGSVVVAGGCTDSACNTATPNTQIYTASNLQFAALPPLSRARGGMSSLRLRDGSLLFAGGCVGAECFATTEVYDPATRAFRVVAPLNQARGRAGIVMLNDGKVLVTGGCQGILCNTVLRSVEVYDPATSRWTETAPMSVPRAGHYAVTLADGRVLVGGGCSQGDCSSFLSSTELYDPSTGRFTAGPAMHQERVGARAIRLPDGKVMVSQGCRGRTDCDLTNELFDPRGNFSMMESALTIRAFHELVVSPPSNQVIAVGGCQPRTCSWWNETYDISGIRPLPDAGPDVLVDASAPDGAVLDGSSQSDVTVDNISSADVVGVSDAGPIPGSEPGVRQPQCQCSSTVGSGGASKHALWAFGVFLLLCKRSRSRSRS